MKKLISFSLVTSLLFANFSVQADDDNEIMIEQSGDTLTIYIDQIGYGNKIGLDDFSSSGSNMTIVGSSLTFDIDMLGNQNLIYGPIEMDSSDLTFSLTGDSNEVDWNIGYTASSDDSDYNFDITGDSNTFNIDQGFVTSAERLDADLVLIGDSNVFDLDFEADDSTWDLDITSDNATIQINQQDTSNDS